MPELPNPGCKNCRTKEGTSTWDTRVQDEYFGDCYVNNSVLEYFFKMFTKVVFLPSQNAITTSRARQLSLISVGCYRKTALNCVLCCQSSFENARRYLKEARSLMKLLLFSDSDENFVKTKIPSTYSSTSTTTKQKVLILARDPIFRVSYPLYVRLRCRLLWSMS